MCHCGKTKMPIFQMDKLNQKQKLWTLNQKQKLFHFTSHKRTFISPQHLRCPRPELQSPKAWFKLAHRRNIFPDCHGTRQDTRRSTQPITVETSTIASSRVKPFGVIFGVKCGPNGSWDSKRKRGTFFYFILRHILSWFNMSSCHWIHANL